MTPRRVSYAMGNTPAALHPVAHDALGALAALRGARDEPLHDGDLDRVLLSHPRWGAVIEACIGAAVSRRLRRECPMP